MLLQREEEVLEPKTFDVGTVGNSNRLSFDYFLLTCQEVCEKLTTVANDKRGKALTPMCFSSLVNMLQRRGKEEATTLSWSRLCSLILPNAFLMFQHLEINISKNFSKNSCFQINLQLASTIVNIELKPHKSRNVKT